MEELSKKEKQIIEQIKKLEEELKAIRERKQLLNKIEEYGKEIVAVLKRLDVVLTPQEVSILLTQAVNALKESNNKKETEKKEESKEIKDSKEANISEIEEDESFDLESFALSLEEISENKKEEDIAAEIAKELKKD